MFTLSNSFNIVVEYNPSFEIYEGCVISDRGLEIGVFVYEESAGAVWKKYGEDFWRTDDEISSAINEQMAEILMEQEWLDEENEQEIRDYKEGVL